MTAAHEQEVRVTFIERWPEHEPRAHDPHFKAFREAKARLKKAGLLVCNVKGDTHYGQIELHHALVEFAHVEDIDVAKFNELYGLHLSDDAFRDFAEGAPATNDKGEPVNSLEPLCTEHHRGVRGIHSLPTPEWGVLRAAKEPAHVITALSNNEIPVVPEGPA